MYSSYFSRKATTSSSFGHGNYASPFSPCKPKSFLVSRRKLPNAGALSPIRQAPCALSPLTPLQRRLHLSLSDTRRPPGVATRIRTRITIEKSGLSNTPKNLAKLISRSKLEVAIQTEFSSVSDIDVT